MEDAIDDARDEEDAPTAPVNDDTVKWKSSLFLIMLWHKP